MSNKPPAIRIDRRAARTRYLLARALIRLGAKENIDELEVGRITSSAGVGRSTFYTHYAGKQDFLLRSFCRLLRTMAATDADEGNGALLPARRLFEHIADSGNFAKRMAESTTFPSLLEAGETELRAIAKSNLAGAFPDWTRERRELTAVFLAAGLFGLVRWWIQSGSSKTPQEMQTAFDQLVADVLNQPYDSDMTP